MTDFPILFRVTWYEHQPNGRVVPRERTVDSLSELQGLMFGLAMNTERYRNIKKYAAKVDWQEV